MHFRLLIEQLFSYQLIETFLPNVCTVIIESANSEQSIADSMMDTVTLLQFPYRERYPLRIYPKGVGLLRESVIVFALVLTAMRTGLFHSDELPPRNEFGEQKKIKVMSNE